MKLIYLSGKHGSNVAVQVDDADFEWLSGFKWHYNHGYAARRGGVKLQYMHRLIMGEPERLEIDHKDLDRLNCQRSNLRVATKAQNQANKPPRSRSGYKGVTFHHGAYQVIIRKEYLGRFSSKEAAKSAYDKRAKELYGDFANLSIRTP